MCVATLMSVTFDCPDPDLLASYFRRLLGLQEAGATRDRSAIALRRAGCLISFLRVQTHRPPTWPDGLQQQQIHLDVATSDLEHDVTRAIDLGAIPAEHQPRPDRWRVMIDPAGHPFCLTTSPNHARLT